MNGLFGWHWQPVLYVDCLLPNHLPASTAPEKEKLEENEYLSIILIFPHTRYAFILAFDLYLDDLET
jgi:hypothetical protein